MSVDQLDIENLDRYLRSKVAGFSGLRAAEKFSGGQSNPTFLLLADSGKYVLRRKPPGVLLKSAHAVDREFRVISALAETDVPVAKAIHLCDDNDVIGSMFYIMSYVEGRIFWDAALPDISVAERGEIYAAMNKELAVLHGVDIDAVNLSDFGRKGQYFERQTARWTKQYLASETEHIPSMNALMHWLPRNMPPDDGVVTLVHGDFRLDNMIFDPVKPHVLALLDWELSTLGHPYADLAYQVMLWRLPSNALVKGLGSVDCRTLGIPTESEYVAQYCEHTGRTGIENWTFYLAFSFFRLASIAQGVKKRAIDGNASNPKAMQLGDIVGLLAQAAVDLIEEDG